MDQLDHDIHQASAQPLACSDAQNSECPAPENESAASETTDQTQHSVPTKESVIAALTLLAQSDGADISRDEIGRLKQTFHNLRKGELEAEKAAYIEAGNSPEDFLPAIDPLEEQFHAALAAVKEKKNLWTAEREESLRVNQERKEAIIAQLQEMASDTDNVNRSFQQFKDLQQEFKAIGDVPQEVATDLWKRFQENVEHFYDQLKINQELRDYDFRKNLEIKVNICEIAELIAASLEQPKAAEEAAESASTNTTEATEEEIAATEEEKPAASQQTDVVEAFRRLQDLHEKWKLTGPVAKELREPLWLRFKEASTTINKCYQTFFEERKAREQAIDAAKTALCERVEAVDTSKLTTTNEWEAATKEIIAAQAEWKQLGYSPRRSNIIFTKFRGICDDFFRAKAEFFQALKDSQAENLAKKTALCERAQQLKDSTDWRRTSDELVELQKQWKEIGPVPRRYSDQLWKSFLGACDYFFEQKKKNYNNSRNEEQNNLETKKGILAEMNALDPSMSRDDATAAINALQTRWKETGHVPYREKDKLNEQYRNTMAELRRRFDLNGQRAAREKFELNVSEMAQADTSRLLKEREKLNRTLDNKRQELSTYENNLGFFSTKTKAASGLLRDVYHKIDLIKGDIAEIQQRIALVNDAINNANTK